MFTRKGKKSKMALSKVCDTFLEILDDPHFREWCQKRQMKFSLLITGKTGVGKSSLVNALVDRDAAKEGRKKVAETREATSHSVVTKGGVEISFWDSPGLGDGTDNDKKYLAEIGSKITEKLDLVIFCLKMTDQRFHRDDKDTFKILTEHFGKELWRNAVIALTFANEVKDQAGGNRKDYFEQDLANWREAIHLFLRNTLKLDPELVQSLPLVPTGYYRPLSVLPSGGNWLSEFFISCYNVARDSSPFSLYLINIGRVRFPGSEMLAAICGGSEATPTSPDLDHSAEMPPIDLNAGQQASFWNRTLEAFKKYCLSIGVPLGVIAILGTVILRGNAR